MSETTSQEQGKRSQGQSCLCGCGGMTKGGRFLPGHDGRLKGQLFARLHANPNDDEAREALERLGWLGLFKPRAPKGQRAADPQGEAKS